MKKKGKRTKKKQKKTKSKLRAFFDAKLADYRSNIDHALALPEAIEAKWESLQGEVVGYRLLLMELFDRPRRIDKALWEDVAKCKTKKERILRSRFRFWMRIPSVLRRRIRKFESMADEIDELITFVQKAKSGARFYSKMQKGKSIKRESIVPGGQSVDDVRESVHALIRVLYYLFVREKMGQPVAAGSNVLRLDDALSYWENELKIIAAHMRDGGIPKRLLVQRINSLRGQLQETPSRAQLVQDLELRVRSLSELTKERQMAGNDDVPREVVVELLRGFEEDIPFAWARGQWEALERYLHKARELIISAEASLKSESSEDAASVADEEDGSDIRDLAPKRREGPAGRRRVQSEPPDDEPVDELLDEMLAKHLGEEDAPPG
jgi:hypothetical protein